MEMKMMDKQLELWNKLNENNTLQEVQQYIKEVIKIRGFSEQEIEKTMLLLLEETGELAKSIRKNATSMSIDKSKINHYDTIESEVADVFIVLSSVCNKLNIDLYTALKDKEKENIKREWGGLKEND
jgi:NTP pyrophosphatase (non-canonical NTP hydrolase)